MSSPLLDLSQPVPWASLSVPATATDPEIHVSYLQAHRPAPALPVVCIHGITANSRHFSSMARFLLASPAVSAVYSIDIRGRGLSGKTGEWGVRHHARDVVRTLDHIGLHRAVLVGHSLGGFITLRAVELLQGRAAGYVLVDSGHPREMGNPATKDPHVQVSLKRAFDRLSLSFDSLDSYVRYWTPTPAALGTDWIDAFRYELAPLHPGPGFHVNVSLEAALADARDLQVAALSVEELERIPNPALLVAAEHGFTKDAPAFIDETIKSALEGSLNVTAPTLVVPGSDHYTVILNVENARLVATHIGAWMETLPSASV